MHVDGLAHPGQLARDRHDALAGLKLHFEDGQRGSENAVVHRVDIEGRTAVVVEPDFPAATVCRRAVILRVARPISFSSCHHRHPRPCRVHRHRPRLRRDAVATAATTTTTARSTPPPRRRSHRRRRAARSILGAERSTRGAAAACRDWRTARSVAAVARVPRRRSRAALPGGCVDPVRRRLAARRVSRAASAVRLAVSLPAGPRPDPPARDCRRDYPDARRPGAPAVLPVARGAWWRCVVRRRRGCRPAARRSCHLPRGHRVAFGFWAR